MTTFTTAVTKVQELVSTKEKLYDKAAGYISEFVIGRMKENKVSNELAVDIAKILNGFTPDEQVKILEKTIVYIVMNTKTNSSKSSSRDKRVYNDGFDDDEDDRNNRRRNGKKEPWSFFDLD